MGIPGLLKELGKGDRIALSKLALDHFERHNRPLRIAIDAAIWNFQTQSGQGGKNPALRTLFYRLLRLLALPIHPVFVYDGKNKPLTKRGKTVNRYGTCVPNELSKNLVARFQFPHHTAPGEAEAECAFLQRQGLVDAVMSQDVDAIMFGSTITLRDWSKEGVKGNKAPTHVNVLDAVKIKELTGLTTSGMVLVAMLSGGDYHDGVPGFGPAVACSIARGGFGEELVEIVRQDDEEGLREWRERLQYELETNESGYFQKRHKTLRVPTDFPDRTVLSYYLEPAVSKIEELASLETRWSQWWKKQIDIASLRDYVGITFDWMYRGGAIKFIRCLAQPLFQHRLKMSTINAEKYTTSNIGDRRKSPLSDGSSEMRFAATPIREVGIDLAAEEENPEFADLDGDLAEEDAELGHDMTRAESIGLAEGSQEPSSPRRQRKRPPWDPNMVEKWWVPETLIKIGLPALHQERQKEQEAIRADPVKFATRKCKPAVKTSTRPAKKIDGNIDQGSITQFILTTKSVLDTELSVTAPIGETRPGNIKRTPLERTRSNPLETISAQSKTLNAYFKVKKLGQIVEAQTPKETTNFLQPLVRKTDSAIAGPIGPEKQKRSLERSKTAPAVIALDEEWDSDNLPDLSQYINTRKRRPKIDLSDAKANAPSSEPLCPVLNMTEDTLSLAVSIRHSQKDAVGEDSRSIAASKLTSKFGSSKVISRDSLPGTWKEVDLTPSQKSKIVYIDLTDD